MSEPHRFHGDPPVSEERVSQFIGRKKNVWFNVAPRYTAGSPALVPRETAMRLADNEAGAYVHALTGRYGKEEQEKAEKLGLMGICEVTHETRKGLDVLDLCTGERYVRPLNGK